MNINKMKKLDVSNSALMITEESWISESIGESINASGGLVLSRSNVNSSYGKGAAGG